MIVYQMPFYSFYTGRPLKVVGFVLTIMATLVVTFFLDIRAALAGMFLLGVCHPVWVSMRLSDLASRHVLVYDNQPERRMVYVQGIPVPNVVTPLRNVLFYTEEHMRRELTRFAFVRFVLFLLCMAIAGWDLCRDAHYLLQPLDWHVLGPLASVLLFGFFAVRGCFVCALWQLGARNAWRVETAVVDGVSASGAYVCLQSGQGEVLQPYLDALFTLRLR